MTLDQNRERPEYSDSEVPETIAARLDGAKTAQANIRFTLGMMAVISTMILIASYNAYLSYDYSWILKADHKFQQSQDFNPPKILQEQALRDWASSRTIFISLLGIRVSVDDAAILGTAVLFILSMWLLLWARREHYTTSRILRDTLRDNTRPPPGTQPMSRSTAYTDQERWLIFHTINSNGIFFAITPSFSSVRSLTGPLPAADTTFKRTVNRIGLPLLRNFFFLFPVITALIVIVIDHFSFAIADPFDPHYGIPGDDPRTFWKSIIALGIWLLLLFCCWCSSRYSAVTESLLRKYHASLDSDSSEQKFAPDNKRP